MAVADGALRGAGGRPMALKRFVNGADAEPFFQKRAPESRPDWIETVELSFPSGRTADEVVLRDAAQLAWIVNLGCLDLNPHPIRAEDLDHPDELRVDLDPVPGVAWDDVRQVALVANEVLRDHGLVGWPKTSGSRGIHVNVRIERRWTYGEVRRAALALAREVERRAPAIATSKWWKEERHGVFLDYNQNAKDRTVASAYSVRPLPDARVSMPLRWDQVADVVAEDYTLATVPAIYETEGGDRHAGIDDAVGSLDALLDLSARDEAAGPGRCAVAAQLSQAGGGAAARPALAPAAAPTRTTTRPRRRLSARSRARRWSAVRADGRREGSGEGCREGGAVVAATGSKPTPTGRRRSTIPVVEIARAAKKDEALAGLERWKERHAGRRAAPAPGGHPHRLDARPLHDVDPHPREPLQRACRDPAGAGAAGSRLRPMGGVRLAGQGRPAGARAAKAKGRGGRLRELIRSAVNVPSAAGSGGGSATPRQRARPG